MDDPPRPPFALTLYWQTESYHALPDAGGLLDQRARLMRTIQACANAYHAARSYARAPAGGRAQWRAENERLDDVLAYVERLRHVR